MEKIDHYRSCLWGNVPNPNKEVKILGGGISGLLLVWHLRNAGYEVVLHEKASHAGGLIHTHHGTFGTFESAANGIIWSAEMEALCKSLSLTPIKSLPQSRKRYVWIQGKWKQVPGSFILPILLRLPFILKSYPHPQWNSIAEMGNEILGTRLLKQVLSPALYGIYAAEAEALSFEAVFPGIATEMNEGKSLFQSILHQRKNQKPSPRKGLHSFEKGIQTLTDALTKDLGDSIRYSSTPEFSPDEQWISCLPAHQIASWTNDSFLKEQLTQLTYLPLVSFTIFLDKKQLPQLPPGFGVLIPGENNLPILGILFNHQIFPFRTQNESIISLTIIAGGPRSGPWNQPSPDTGEIEQLLLKALKKILPFEGNPLEQNLFLYPQALPLYGLNYPIIKNKIRAYLSKEVPNLSLFGNYTGEISIRGLCKVSAWIAQEGRA